MSFRRDDTGRPRSPNSVQRKIRAEWDRAVRFAADNPAVTDPDFARELVREYQTVALVADWSGRTGLRDRTVLAALHDIAMNRGTVTPYVSIRTLCEATPYRGIKTVHRALVSLAERGWLSRIAPESP